METWKQIPSAPDDDASSLGRIRRNAPGKRTYPGRLLALHTHSRTGYKVAVVSVDKKSRPVSVHRLVMEAFHGPSDRDVNHINGVRDDNRLENLEYATRKENICHARDSLRSLPVGEKRWNACLTEEDVKRIFRLHAKGYTLSQIGEMVGGYHKVNIHRILKRKIWKHVEIPLDVLPA